MNNKEFLNELSARCDITVKEARQLVEGLTNVLADTLDDGDTFSLQNFGTYEVKMKKERIIVNPSTKQRQLVPPKLTIAFKASNTLKDKLKK
jgi:SPBc2 prophage-derived DNA-binding protein HU 2